MAARTKAVRRSRRVSGAALEGKRARDAALVRAAAFGRAARAVLLVPTEAPIEAPMGGSSLLLPRDGVRIGEANRAESTNGDDDP